MRSRSGYALIEMVTALALITTTFSLVIVVLHGVYRSDQRVHEELRHELDWGRFAGQFRADGHRAERAQPGEDAATTLVFHWAPDQQAEYRLRGHRVERLERRQGEIRQQETYTLPKALKAQWQIASGGEHPLASLVLEPESASATGTFAPRPTHIDCAVGLLHPRSQPSNP